MHSVLKYLASAMLLLQHFALAQAPTTSGGALQQARSKYSASLGELVDALSVNCVSNIVTVVNCDRAFVSSPFIFIRALAMWLIHFLL